MINSPDIIQNDNGITIARAGEILGYSRTTISRMIKRGEIVAYGTHKMKRISMTSIQAYKKRTQTTTAKDPKPITLRRVNARITNAINECDELLGR